MSPQVSVGPYPAIAHTIDTTGEVCPYPALRMKEALETLRPGGALEVFTNNRATVTSSVPVLCRTMGARAHVEAQGERWRVVLWRA